MKKIRLSLDALRVESFETGGEPREGGTVHAHATRPNQNTCAFSCATCITCQTCPKPTFEESCPETCTCPGETEPGYYTCSFDIC
jgi:hypothetical protein